VSDLEPCQKRRQGQELVRVPFSVAEMRLELDIRGWENTPENRGQSQPSVKGGAVLQLFRKIGVGPALDSIWAGAICLF
jgi:hypothetical protein